MKIKPKNRIPSGFRALDTITGGYVPGVPTVILSTETYDQGDSLAGYILEQTWKCALAKRKTLVLALSSTDDEYVRNIMHKHLVTEDLDLLMQSPLYIVGFKDNCPSPQELLEYITRAIDGEEPYEAIIIDDAWKLFENDGDPSNSTFRFLKDLADVTRDMKGPVLVTDYDNRLETTERFSPVFPEIIINHDVYGRMQLAVYAEGEKMIVEDLYGMNLNSPGISIIEAERIRQMVQEGYSKEHDLCHVNGELADAAASYALTERSLTAFVEKDRDDVPMMWPFEKQAYKPTPGNRVRQLAKAGAFIAAEIDRILAEGLKKEIESK
jgi:hypothetical protein